MLSSRHFLLPFPISLAIAFGILEVYERYREHFQSAVYESSPAEGMIIPIFLFIAFLFQAIVGIPSLIYLEDRNKSLKSYLIAGILISLVSCLGVSTFLSAPHFRESVFSTFSYSFLIFGIPTILCYTLAFLSRKITTKE
jgi:hypothetical protein